MNILNFIHISYLLLYSTLFFFLFHLFFFSAYFYSKQANLESVPVASVIQKCHTQSKRMRCSRTMLLYHRPQHIPRKLYQLAPIIHYHRPRRYLWQKRRHRLILKRTKSNDIKKVQINMMMVTMIAIIAMIATIIDASIRIDVRRAVEAKAAM